MCQIFMQASLLAVATTDFNVLKNLIYLTASLCPFNSTMNLPSGKVNILANLSPLADPIKVSSLFISIPYIFYSWASIEEINYKSFSISNILILLSSLQVISLVLNLLKIALSTQSEWTLIWNYILKVIIISKK